MMNRKRASMRKMEDVIMNERLSEFESYVEGNSADPNAQLTLSLIREFKQEFKHKEQEVSNPKELSFISPGPLWPDPNKARSMPWFRRLRQFQEWLKSRHDAHSMTLVLRWIAEFELKKIEEWAKENVQGYLGDPPDTKYQKGFLSALLLMEEEALGLPPETPPFAEARELSVERAKRRMRKAA
jgi:hypothetical protein